MTVERMLEYLICDKILSNRVEMTKEEFYPLFERRKSLEDEFVNEYKLPGSNKSLVKDWSDKGDLSK